MPETAGYHGVSRVTDARRRIDDAQASGHQVIDPDSIRVPPIRHQLDNVSFRDETHRPVGLRVQEHERGRSLVPHQVCGPGHVIIRLDRRQRWPHNVRDGGRDRWQGRLLRRGFWHDPLRFRDLGDPPGIPAMLHAMTRVNPAGFHRRVSIAARGEDQASRRDDDM